MACIGERRSAYKVLAEKKWRPIGNRYAQSVG
jgi:hypothetical protein